MGDSRYEKLDALSQHRNLLLLQGPNGPFFDRLAVRLNSLGANVTKVNFNGGDAFFYRQPAVEFTGLYDEWPQYLLGLLASKSIGAIVLFGQWRPMHRTALDIARETGIKVFVFEEGYARPWWITLEEGGVNDASALASLNPSTLPSYPQAQRPQRFRYMFARMAAYSFLYFGFGMAGRRRFPHYVHHKAFGIAELLRWGRSGYRRVRYGVKEKKTLALLHDQYGPDFFIVPLQINTDSQIVHASPWESNDAFIEATIRSFATHAAVSDLLVFKHHPLERGHADYTSTIDRVGSHSGVRERIHYIHGGHLPTLLKRSKGAVTVNSTAGLQALYHGIAVCTTGNAFYARPGLIDEENLDRFWQNPVEPNRQLFTRFFRYMMHTTQINASFYVPDDLAGKLIRPRIRRILASTAGSCAALFLFDSGGATSAAKVLLAWIVHASLLNN